eukprot:scaffold6519_cov156-Ochromonas_danica.AAC.8
MKGHGTKGTEKTFSLTRDHLVHATAPPSPAEVYGRGADGAAKDLVMVLIVLLSSRDEEEGEGTAFQHDIAATAKRRFWIERVEGDGKRADRTTLCCGALLCRSPSKESQQRVEARQRILSLASNLQNLLMVMQDS